MIDYDATLKSFFDEVILFLDKRKARARDEVEMKRIVDMMAIVRAVSENPRKYADYNARVKDGLVEHAEAFMPTPHDNTAFLIYSGVLWKLSDLYSQFDYQRQEAQKALLSGLKQMKYKNAGNILKDLYFPFISPEKYAVKQTR